MVPIYKDKGVWNPLCGIKLLEHPFKVFEKVVEYAYDRVPREVVYWALRKKGVSEKLIRIVKAMYDGVQIQVLTAYGKTEAFELIVGLHQCSALSPLLFIVVMDVLEIPWDNTR